MEPTDPNLIKPAPVQSPEPIKPEPVQPEPVQPAPGQPAPPSLMKPPVDSTIVLPQVPQAPAPAGVMQPPVKSEIIMPTSQASITMPFDTNLFRDRIYTRDWSYFTGENHLMVNKKEVEPANEPVLTDKIFKHYRIMEPGFFSFQPRSGIAMSLASYVMTSRKTRETAVLKDLSDMYLEDKAGIHPEQTKHLKRYGQPFESQAKFWQNPTEVASTPEIEEMQATGLSLYLILNEALKARGRNLEVAGYISDADSPDHLISQLSPLLGISPLQMTETLIKDGVDGMAKLLNVDPHLTAEIKQLAELAKVHEFPDNIPQNWNVGRSIEDMKARTLEEKIEVGVQVRTAKKLDELRGHEFPEMKPADIQAVEDRVINVLRRMPLELQQALYYSGVEIVLTPDKTVEKLFGFPVEALGLHEHASYVRGDMGGIIQLYVGSMYSAPDADKTLVHEAHHYQAPKSYTQTQLQAIDGLLKNNWLRMAELEKDLGAWASEKSPERRQAMVGEMEKKFALGDKTLAKTLGGQVTEAGLLDLYYFVCETRKNLDPANGGLSRGYGTPELRATEFISRLSEIIYVRGVAKPALLAFTAPDALGIYDQFYLPHVRNELAKMKNGEQPVLPAYMIQAQRLTAEVLNATLQQQATPPQPQPQPQPQPAAQVATMPHLLKDAASLRFATRPTQMVSSSSGGGFAEKIGNKAAKKQAPAERFSQRLDTIEERPAQLGV